MKLTPNPKSYPSFNLERLKNLRLAIIQAKFNQELTDQMTLEALKAFEEIGGDKNQIDVFEVPGSFEIPLAAKKAAQTRCYDAILCFGVIIKGETYHFESVSDACVQGINQVILETEIPLSHVILTTYTLKQAVERICLAKEYLFGTLQMLETLQQIENKAHSFVS